MQTNQTIAASAVPGLTVWQGSVFDDDYQETESGLYRTFGSAVRSLDLSRLQRVQHLDLSELSVADLARLVEFLADEVGGANLSLVYDNSEGHEETFNVNSRSVIS